MINKLAKAQKGWAAKLILSLTALSFMSLFGVSSYLSNANNNRTVIKVDNIEIPQSQFAYLAQKEFAMVSRLLGENQEITEEMRTALLSGLAQKLVTDSVVDRTAEKYGILFSPIFIHNIIVNDPTFKDETGNFNRDIFRELLSKSGLSEAEYIKSISRDLVRRLLVDTQVLNVNVPKVLLDATTKVDNKRRTFKYVNINTSDMVIDRSITDEEINQYYEDFASNFMEPERRDISVLYVPMQDIYKNIEVSADDIKFYYDDNKSDYETAEKRQVLQIVFDDEKQANKAFFELQQGADFYDVAQNVAGQSKEDINLGYATSDELLPELATEVFSLKKNQYTKPIKVEDLWQIAKVADIQEASKVDYAVASAEIEKILKDERLYDASYEVIASIEDKLAAGTDLETVATELGLNVKKVLGLADDGSMTSEVTDIKDLVKNADFTEASFSYALGETSQVIETDDGLFTIRVDAVNDAHPKAVEDVKNEIIKLWSDNEKTAIAQEKLNDIMHDLENGDNLSDVAPRYGFKVYKSRPITRNETFANISYADVRAMFVEALNTPRQMQYGDNYVVAVAVEDYDNSVTLSAEEKDLVKRKAYQSLVKDFADALLKSYADDYKVRIKYKLIGLTDL